MRAVCAIAKKEVLSFFFAPMAYIVVASFLVMNGFIFSVILAALSQPGAFSASPMAVFFGGTMFFWIYMILMAPVVTMKLGAEERKSGTLKKIFGQEPHHAIFIPLDMAQAGCWGPLAEGGWSADAKTLFVLEGLVMYLAHPAVEDLLAGIACHAGAGSAVLFDFLPASLADGTSDAEGGQYIRDWTIRIGEPILSGFAEGTVEPFLAALGFSGITIVSPRDLAHRYFTGKRAERKVSGLMSLAYATVAGTGGVCL